MGAGIDGVEGHEQLGSGHILVTGNGGGISRGMRAGCERREVEERKRVAAAVLGRGIGDRHCTEAARIILCRPVMSVNLEQFQYLEEQIG